MDYSSNVNLTCYIQPDPTVLASKNALLNFVDAVPCASAVALLTIITIEHVIIPRNPIEQEKLIQRITIQQVISITIIIGIGFRMSPVKGDGLSRHRFLNIQRRCAF